MKYALKLRMPKFDYKKIFYRALSLAAVLLVVSGYIAYTRMYLTPERRLWMALNNSLSSPSVVRTVETGGTGNKSIEVTRFAFGAQAAQDKLSSVGFKNATSESNVTTETITTPKTQYVRYVNIFSTEKKEDGSTYNFDSIKNVWAKESDPADADAANNLRLSFLQPLITLVPFGNLSPSERQAILADMKASGAYVINYKDVTKEEDGDQEFYSYSVKVQTKKYVTVLQRYFKAAGYGEFPPLDPSGYPDNARVNAKFLVNARSNVIAGISFNDHNESYDDYGVTKQIAMPSKTIGIDELQSKLQAAQ